MVLGDRLRLHDDQGRFSVGPKPGAPHPADAATGSQLRTFARPFVDGQLLSRGKVLDGSGSVAENERPEE